MIPEWIRLAMLIYFTIGFRLALWVVFLDANSGRKPFRDVTTIPFMFIAVFIWPVVLWWLVVEADVD